MNSHIESKLGHIVSAPLYSAPYETVEDCMEDAPECTLVWLNSEGSYQFSECDCKWGFRQIMDVARGCYEVSNLSLIAWRNGHGWQDFGE